MRTGLKQLRALGACIYWIKTIYDDQVPIKIVYTVDMSFPAKAFLQLLDPKNLKARNYWDKAVVEHGIVETYPDGRGYVKKHDEAYQVFGPTNNLYNEWIPDNYME